MLSPPPAGAAAGAGVVSADFFYVRKLRHRARHPPTAAGGLRRPYQGGRRRRTRRFAARDFGCVGLFRPHRPFFGLDLFGRGEPVALLVGALEDGSRVETLVFAAAGRAAQSTGSWVFSGLWSGTHVLTLNGHSLDADGCCFCRACDLANGYEQSDED